MTAPVVAPLRQLPVFRSLGAFDRSWFALSAAAVADLTTGGPDDVLAFTGVLAVMTGLIAVRVHPTIDEAIAGITEGGS